MTEIKNILLPSFVVGIGVAVFMTVLGLIPIIGSILNMACCLWLTAAGFIAVFISKSMSGKITTQEGITVGVFTGIIQSIVATFLGGILMLLNLGFNMTAGLDALGLGFGAGFGIISLIVAFIMSFFISIVFCGIGGLLAAILLGKR